MYQIVIAKQFAQKQTILFKTDNKTKSELISLLIALIDIEADADISNLILGLGIDIKIVDELQIVTKLKKVANVTSLCMGFGLPLILVDGEYEIPDYSKFERFLSGFTLRMLNVFRAASEGYLDNIEIEGENNTDIC